MSADLLREIDDLLARAEARAVLLPDSPDRVGQCGLAILGFRIDRARRAVADLLAYQSPARQTSHRLAAVGDGPDRAGEPPLPGTGFSLPGRAPFPMFDPVADRDPTDFSDLAVAGKPIPVAPFPSRTEPFEFGAGQALYDVLPGRSS